MNEKQIIDTLIKIYANQQKILTKLAQQDPMGGALSFIKSLTSAWVANYLPHAKYNVNLVQSSDPTHQLEVVLNVASLDSSKPIPADTPAKFEAYMQGMIVRNPFLQSKQVKIMVHIVSSL
jgi:hypothetical protein